MSQPATLPTPPSPSPDLEDARQVLLLEAEAIEALATRLNGEFVAAVELILARGKQGGRVIVSGMGKSGHIGRKIAATLASTGTPAYFVHPGEASHGDLGMILPQDVLLALSYSGEAEELLRIIPIVKRMGAALISLTGNPASALAREADVHLDARVDREACPHNLAPTTSTTAALALGDALAMALLKRHGFSPDDFARSHPGGRLGRRLLTHVADVMRPVAEVPQVAPDTTLAEAILAITRGGLGMTAVCRDGRVAGIFTDGDLRRLFSRGADLNRVTMAEVMTRNPKSIGPERLAVDAVTLMETHRINQLLVIEGTDTLAGALNMHDLFQAKVI